MTGKPPATAVLNVEQITRILREAFAQARGTTTEQLVVLEASLREAIELLDKRVDGIPEQTKESLRKYTSTLEAAYREAFSKWVSWREDFKRGVEKHLEMFQQEQAEILSEQQRLAAGVHDDGIAFGKDLATLRENLDAMFTGNRQELNALNLGVDSAHGLIRDLTEEVGGLNKAQSESVEGLLQTLRSIETALDLCGTRDAKTSGELAKLDADFRAVSDEWASFATLVADLQALCSDEFAWVHTFKHDVLASIEDLSHASHEAKTNLATDRERLDEHRARLDTLQQRSKDHRDLHDALRARVVSVSEYVAGREAELLEKLDACVTNEQAAAFATIAGLEGLREKMLELALQVDASRGEAHTDIAERFEAAADEFLGFQQRIERRVEDIAATLAQSIANVRDWQSEGPPYWANSVVRHRGGIWIAVRETVEAPGASPDWNLLFEGIDWVDMGTDKDDATRMLLNLRTSSGRETEFGMNLPSFTFHGTWSADKKYRARDTVMHDGHRWVALRDSPEGEPSESEHWRLFAMRGPRGRKGDRGPSGETPSTKDFILAWREHLDVADGTPVMRFRGAWSFEKTFMAGDVVSYEKSLYIAVVDQEASFEPPTVTQDSGWAMFAPYRTVGSGATVREVEGQTGF